MHIDSYSHVAARDTDMQLSVCFCCEVLLSTAFHNSKTFGSCCRQLAARKRPEVVCSPAAYSCHSASRRPFRSRYFLRDCRRSLPSDSSIKNKHL